MSGFIGSVQLIAGGEADLPRVLELLEGNGIATKGNPDLSVEVRRGFGIDDARALAAKASLKAVAGQRVFVIVSGSFTTEAQNALLKTLEDSAALFFIVTPSPQLLLPTVRSRAQYLELNAKTAGGDVPEAKAFLAASPAKRLEFLKPLLEKEEGESRDLTKILGFLDSLERLLAAAPQANRTGIAAVYRAKEYARDKGALMKSLLEQVALLI